MKHFSSSVAALAIASTLIAPCATFAQGVNHQEGTKVGQAIKGNKTIDFICSGVTSTPMIRQAKLDVDQAKKIADKNADRDARVATIKSNTAFNLANRSAKLDLGTHKLFGKKFVKRTLNDAEKVAINTYASSVESAAKVRTDAIKAAQAAEKTATAGALATRKTAIDAAIAARKTAIDAAVATLKTKCDTTGADRLAAEKAFKDSISAARTTYQAAIKAAMKTYLDATKPARETRAAAVKKAQETYKAAVKAAKEKLMADLKAAKPVSTSTTTE